MIAASGILVIIAFVTLIIGVFQAGLGLIWASIAASVLAAIFLALGVVQTNKRRVAPAASGRAPAPAWSDQQVSTAVIEREVAPELTVVPMHEEEEEEEELEAEAALTEPAPEPETAIAAFEPPAPTRAKPAAARSSTAKAAGKAAPAKAAAKAGGAAKAPAKAKSATAATVVVIPDRDKYHLETCRYAKNASAVSMTKASARRQGYKPCATCKP